MKDYQRDYLDFLPAALEIQETPPLPASRFILWSILIFFTIAIIWSYIGQINIVCVAHGKIIPTGKVKKIQSPESGVVKKINVIDGEKVIYGQPLVELDTTMDGAEYIKIQEQQLLYKLERVRILTILDEINPVRNKYDHLKDVETADPELLWLLKEKITRQIEEHKTTIAALMDEKNQRIAESEVIKKRVQQLDLTIPLVTERAGSSEVLVKKNMLPRLQWLELEQERLNQVKEREIQFKLLDGLKAGIANINKQLQLKKTRLEIRLLSEFSDMENRISALEQEKIKIKKSINLKKLIAPVSGTVHQLLIHTVGGVVTPAQELMQIVPDQGSIEVEAWLPNKDIGFVYEGQEAEIKIETFPFTKYGTIDAEITNISGDATLDEQMGFVYAIRLGMSRTTMKINEKTVKLTPGMLVTVEINQGKRRLIEYLLSPLLRYKDESIRER